MLDTRTLPYEQIEIEWARCRPPADRVAVPAAGDRVWYRHDPWTTPTPATVDAVQDLDDQRWPNNWRPVRGCDGGLVIPSGTLIPLVERQPDPWPLVYLHTSHGYLGTQEARLRGAAGWLPRDWTERCYPLPDELRARAVTRIEVTR